MAIHIDRALNMDGRTITPQLEHRNCKAALAPDCIAALSAAFIDNIPTVILPLSLAVAYGFSEAEAYWQLTSVCREFLCRNEDQELTICLVPGKEKLSSVGESSPKRSFREPAAEYLLSDDYRTQDRCFADMCEWWCEHKKLSKAEFYARSNISKSMFWNMKHHPEQVPRKTSVLACAVGLRLTLEQTNDLLLRAGLSLSRYYRLDSIVESFIRKSNYDIDQINAALYDEDQVLLGSVRFT